MHYYEVLIADGRYHSSTPLTYSSSELVANLSVVSVPLRNRPVTGFVIGEVPKPSFAVKEIRAKISDRPLPFHCLELAEWMRDYYASTFSEALRLFAPATPVIRRAQPSAVTEPDLPENLALESPLTSEQSAAVVAIKNHPSTTVLLQGETGSGKTRVYLELAEETLAAGRSVILLTPEIALTSQLFKVVSKKLSAPIYVVHSELSPAERKKIWFQILEAAEPVVIIGPRSALFMPIASLGLIIVDEAHEQAYKQEQAPRYHTNRVASQLGTLTSARVVLGSATPSVVDYYLATQREAVVRMRLQATSGKVASVPFEVVDLRDKKLFTRDAHLSDKLISEIKAALLAGKQTMLYYNRRGSARLILCTVCGWQLLCPNCDVPLVYHGDEHLARCHICGHRQAPPNSCPTCGNPDVIYKSIGTKTLMTRVQKLFPSARLARYDSDNLSGETLSETYEQIYSGQVDILVGTQVLAKGLDLPRLGLVGVVSAETSLGLPDYTAEERTFQLLYQVMGRVGRGHTGGKVVLQSYEPEAAIISSATGRDWQSFYEITLTERQNYRFPPFSYLLKLVCRRATLGGAQKAAERLQKQLLGQNLPVEIIGPSPSFYQRQGKYYYYKLVIKSKERRHLVALASLAPAGWSADLDPSDLL